MMSGAVLSQLGKPLDPEGLVLAAFGRGPHPGVGPAGENPGPGTASAGTVGGWPPCGDTEIMPKTCHATKAADISTHHHIMLHS